MRYRSLSAIKHAVGILLAIAIFNTGAWARTLYVKADATGTDPTGLTWEDEDAFTVIQDAMDAATDEDEIWVAKGTYYVPASLATSEAVLTMKDGVAVYGGFYGTEENLSERDLTTNETKLDGNGESYHVVVGASNAVLDGFTITGGNAAGDDPDDNGGGVYNKDVSNLVISKCIIENNSANDGGGIYNYYYSTPTVTNCILRNNSAYRGGGMFNNESTPEITNCTFNGNSADDRGGGIYSYDNSSPVITNCILWGDSAGTSGNEIYDTGSSSSDVEYSDVQGGYTGAGNINQNPQLESELHLSPDSPCIDHGTEAGAPSDDIEGFERPSGLYPDMGAYEYQFSTGTCWISLVCPVSVSENSPIICEIAYNGSECADTLSLGINNTCAGATVTDDLDGTGSYNAPEQGEDAGPGSCVAEVQMVADGESDSEIVTINEAEAGPSFYLEFGNERIYVYITPLEDTEVDRYIIYYSSVEKDLNSDPPTSNSETVDYCGTHEEEAEISIKSIATECKYTIEGLNNGVTYYVRVRAVDTSDDESELSEIKSVTPQETQTLMDAIGESGGCAATSPGRDADIAGTLLMCFIWALSFAALRRRLIHARRVK